jgi:uncharacterized protein DUF4398
MSAWKSWSIATAAGALAVGCQSVPSPRDAIAEADEAITQARAHDAEQYAPLPLREAEDKVQKARAEARDHDQYGTARRFAEQAQVDAQLALAEAEKAKTQENVDELERTVRALEEELDHGIDQQLE